MVSHSILRFEIKSWQWVLLKGVVVGVAYQESHIGSLKLKLPIEMWIGRSQLVHWCRLKARVRFIYLAAHEGAHQKLWQSLAPKANTTVAIVSIRHRKAFGGWYEWYLYTFADRRLCHNNNNNVTHWMVWWMAVVCLSECFNHPLTGLLTDLRRRTTEGRNLPTHLCWNCY